MSYIKITNTSPNVNRLKLEKLGFSTKRDDENTIGQFGSGIKFAPIAAVRRGMEFIFKGNDDSGSYILEYIVKDEGDIKSVYYKYQDYEKPSSFTVDAGVLSWENDFQIYREVIANAMDEVKINGGTWDIEIVDSIDLNPIDGEFSVYITATESMLNINNNFDNYFCVNRDPLFAYPERNMYTRPTNIYKRADGDFRVYSKGVLVFSSEQVFKNTNSQRIGLFDYEFDNLKLNEERTVASQYELSRAITQALANINNVDITDALLDVILDIDNNEEMYYEFSDIPTYMYNLHTSNNTWLESMEKKYPNTVLLRSHDSTVNVRGTIKSRGYDCIEIEHEGVWNFLISLGFKQAKDIFGENFQYEYHMGFDNYPKLTKSLDVLTLIFPEMEKVKDIIGTFSSGIEDDEEVLGITLSINNESGDMKKVILIEKDHAKYSPVKEIVSTIVHEWDHYSTLISDGDMEGRMFRNVADRRIADLVDNVWQLMTGESL